MNQGILLASRSALINWQIVKTLADMQAKGRRIRAGVIQFYEVSGLKRDWTQ